MTIPLPRQIAAVERELHMRRQVYPRWVAQGRKTKAEADEEIAAMEAVLNTLLEVRRQREPGLFDA